MLDFLRWPHWLVIVLVMLIAGIYARPAGLLNGLFASSLDPERGQLRLAALQSPVTVRRDELGIPVIEAQNTRDLAVATGYVMASDRYEQMLSFALLAQGRLAEMAGPAALEMDIYMRTLNLDGISRQQYAQMDAEMKRWLEAFAQGVNGWLDQHRDHLPLGLAMTGYQPEPWQPLNSQHVFTILSLALGVNLHEELAFLAAVQKVGLEKARWLFPVYPDEPLPDAEIAKLAGVAVAPDTVDLSGVEALSDKLKAFGFSTGKAASNNWVVAPKRTKSGASILANDTHLLLSHPPLWMLLQLRSPDYQAAGIAVAGIPGIVAGTNGKVGWGMTMVMADSQDVFLEQLRKQEGLTQYLYQGQWYPVEERTETFSVLNGLPVQRVIQTTRHGPMIQNAVKGVPVNLLQPQLEHSDYGLAVAQTITEPDQSMRALFDIARATSVEQAVSTVRQIGFIHLNMVLADHGNIAWRITGRYPKRKAGTGHLPSPGWTGEYDWEGYVDVAQYPESINPPAGFIATANHRTVENPGFTMSSSWYYPERFERIAEALLSKPQQTAEDSIALQFDQHNLLVGKLKTLLRRSEMQEALTVAIEQLSLQQKVHAREALEAILDFDGNMTPDSVGASYFGMFEHQLARLTFMDELGGEASSAWNSLVAVSGLAYSAEQDHLLGRENSPFWDDVTTSKKETKADIFARALAETTGELLRRWGADRARWQWGRLHYYFWASPSTEMKPFLDPLEQSIVDWLGRYLDRGPYPAGGDRNTVNVAGHSTGSAFKAWDVPAMRMVIDFGQDEPLYLINSGGQSGNPASPHYDDGIPVWLAPGNRKMPLQKENILRQYDRVLTLVP